VRALDVATKALARRDFSERGLRERIELAGVDPDEATAVLRRLRDEGLVDDMRFAANRARGLADRGKGDAAIRFDLARQGVGPEAIERALAVLEPERDRAQRILARRGAGAATARLLSGRGFADETVAAAVAREP
jgi:SOS response regulatory protein OraA/RecX